MAKVVMYILHIRTQYLTYGCVFIAKLLSLKHYQTQAGLINIWTNPIDSYKEMTADASLFVRHSSFHMVYMCAFDIRYALEQCTMYIYDYE